MKPRQQCNKCLNLERTDHEFDPFSVFASFTRGFACGVSAYVPAILDYHEMQLSVQALIDSGAAVNVLPHSVGIQLGAKWPGRSPGLPLSGNLAGAGGAHPLDLTVIIPGLPPARLLFAWVANDIPPVIFGQTNFFHQFDVCFFGSRGEMEIRPVMPSAPAAP